MTETSRLPRPVTESWDWQRYGACRNANNLFFHPEAERGRARSMRIAQAKSVCRRCPVLVECRHHALIAEEPYGIWGGMDERERREAIARRRRLPAA